MMTNLIKNNFQAHPFHLVSPSPWHIYTCISLLILTITGVLTITMQDIVNSSIICGFVYWYRDMLNINRTKTLFITVVVVTLLAYCLCLACNINLPHIINLNINYSSYKCIFVILSFASIIWGLHLLILNYLESKVVEKPILDKIFLLFTDLYIKVKSLINNPLFWMGTFCCMMFLAFLLKWPFIVVLDIDLRNHFDFVYMGIVVWTPLRYLLGISLQVYSKFYLPNYKEKLNFSPYSVNMKSLRLRDLIMYIFTLSASFYARNAFFDYYHDGYSFALLSIIFLVFFVFCCFVCIYLYKRGLLFLLQLPICILSIWVAINDSDLLDVVHCDSDSDSDWGSESEPVSEFNSSIGPPVTATAQVSHNDWSFQHGPYSPVTTPTILSGEAPLAPLAPLTASAARDMHHVRVALDLSDASTDRTNGFGPQAISDRMDVSAPQAISEGSNAPARMQDLPPVINPEGSEVWQRLASGFLPNLLSEYMLDGYRGSLVADRSRVNNARTLNADPNTPIGLVHDGAYIANLIEAFPYRKGVTINEPTIREFIVHVAATYANKAKEYHVTPQHGSGMNLGSRRCLDIIRTDTRKLLRNPPLGLKPGSTFAELTVTEAENAHYNTVIHFINTHSDEDFKHFFNNYQGDARMFINDLRILLDRIRPDQEAYTKNIKTILLELCRKHKIDMDVLRNEMKAHLVSGNMPAIRPERTSILQFAVVRNAFRQ